MKDKPMLVSTWGRPQKFFDWFVESTKRNGLEPHNADSNDWPGAEWYNREWYRKSQAQAKFVRENASNYSHMAFCDSYDVAFTAGWDEILSKFKALDSPIVFGAECYCWPDLKQASLYPPTPHRCKFLNAGFWMCETEAAISFTQDLAERAALKDRCDQQIVVDMLLSKRHPIKLDTACSLCFCLNIDSPSYLDFSGPRIKTTDTGEAPVMFHANGGSDLRPVLHKLYDQWHKKT